MPCGLRGRGRARLMPRRTTTFLVDGVEWRWCSGSCGKFMVAEGNFRRNSRGYWRPRCRACQSVKDKAAYNLMMRNFYKRRVEKARQRARYVREHPWVEA